MRTRAGFAPPDGLLCVHCIDAAAQANSSSRLRATPSYAARTVFQQEKSAKKVRVWEGARQSTL